MNINGSIRMNFENITKDMGKAIDKVPEIYDDGLKKTVTESGEVVALIPRTIKAALAPLRIWIAQKEYNVAETEKLLEQKLKNVDEEKIVSPESYVAVPAIQAISYSMNSDELRNLYANLLAKAMIISTKDAVHPSFVEIIKQMSPLDSIVFKEIMERQVNPMLHLTMKNSDGAFTTFMTNVTDINLVSDNLISNVTDINLVSDNLISVSIDNLARMKLIQIPEDRFYTNDKIYDPIFETDYYKKQKERHPKTVDGFEFSYVKKMIEKTNLGKLFYEICVKEL